MRNIFIDTDMGNDDIMAIMLLLLSPGVKISGISVVNGVATKDNGYRNLIDILSFLKISIPARLGYQSAIVEKVNAFPEYDVKRANNLTLLNKLRVPKIKEYVKSNESIEEFIYNYVTKNNSTILALGPLTNLAKTIIKYGDKFTKQVKNIYLMGGGINSGNVSPLRVAEYNIWLDPEAAEIVFSSGVPITMVGIDATNYVKATQSFADKIKKYSPKDNKTKILQEIIVNNDGDFSAFFDPLTAYLLLENSIISEKMICGIKISLLGKSRGQTIPIKDKTKNVNVIMKINPEKFYNRIEKFMLEY